MTTVKAHEAQRATKRDRWWFVVRFSDLPRRFGRVTSGGTYVPQIDGLRFLAIVPVLFFHAGLRGARISPDPVASEALLSPWLPAGGAGVSLFFFISGYIISYPFLTNRAPQLSSFYKRRLLRLEPPYIVAMLGCFFILTQYTPVNAPNFGYTTAPLWQSLLASLTYTHGLIFGASPKLNPPAWSLEREIQFYLLAPFLLYAYQRIKRRDLRLWAGGFLCLLFLLVGRGIEAAFVEQHPLRHTLLAESYSFFLGIVVCDYAVAAQPFAQPAQRRYDLYLAVGYIVFLLTGICESTIVLTDMFEPVLAAELELVNTIVRAVCIVLIFLGAARGRMGRAILGWPWITLIGGACYSIYLVHLPTMQAGAEVIRHIVRPHTLAEASLLSWTFLMPLSIAVGMVFYICVERPCMRPNWPRELVQTINTWLTGRRPSPTVHQASSTVATPPYT